MADAPVTQDAEHRELTESKKSSGGFDGAYLLTALFSFVALAAAGLALFVVMDRTDGSSSVSGPPQDVEADLTLTEFEISGDLVVAAGNLTMNVENSGSQVHNVVVERQAGGGLGRTTDISAGGFEELEIGLISEGTYTLFCDIAGHRESGMEATFVVAPADAPLAAAQDGEGGGLHGGDVPDWAALDEAMTTSMMQFPAETEGKGNTALEPTIAADGTYEYELTAAITPWEVEPGKIVDAWTYNGQVPGPQIRVPLGVNLRIKLINDLPMGTDIHWHGVHTPNDQDGVAPYTQDLIEAGTEFTYEFVAEDPAVGMYHAHHHGQLQVPNGMFGAIIIGDTPLPLGQTISGVTIPQELELAEEIPMVLNDAGVIGLSLNGKSFPATEPSSLTQGDWMVIHYYNEGLQIHPMHLHQFPQLIFAKDGIPLDQPYYADTINVAPGERYSVLFQAEDPGVWVWHCHILSHVERETGMFGMVTAVIVEEEEQA